MLTNKVGNRTKITLTVKEVSDYIGVSSTTIYTMVRLNEIPHIRVRGKILFNRDVVEKWTKGELIEI